MERAGPARTRTGTARPGLPRDARAAFVGALDTLRGHNSPHWSEAIAELRTFDAGRPVPADGRRAGLAPE
ncbi:hypothetical protein [Streptomyces sp. NPDC085479]|uniref:hypothetical protein n=1 Tax=Streptomyces sp. NPDC085479 TaxID=3365726 RepID=UPI0037D93C3E